MSVFEPDIIRHALRNLLCTSDERQSFDEGWDKSVSDCISTWTKSGDRDTENRVAKAEMEWAAHVVTYVSFLHSQAKINTGRSKSTQRPPYLKSSIPILGPRFLPPTFRHVERRSEFPDIDPMSAYLKPLNIVHPFYFPSLAICPRCRGSNIRWDGWTSTGPRNVVYGIRRPELALGYQLRCNTCKKARSQLSGGITKSGKKKKLPSYSCATTNPLFWEKWEYWEMPREVPVFFKKCAVTRDLLDLVLEVRITTTSRGLAENIKQLHLLEYHQVVSEYLECFKRRECWYKPHVLKNFSEPWDENGYNGKSISGDLIIEIILDNTYRTRQEESSEYLRTLKAKSISIDATFKITQKATVASSDLTRTDPHKGGLMSALSETNECVKWKFSATQSNGELQEFLNDLGERFAEQEEPPPEDVTADNCCHVRSAIVHALPNAHVGLDVYHFMMRYQVASVTPSTNLFRSQVMCDIRDAILISPANSKEKIPAKYRTKEEQEEMLQAAYLKWARHGGVWTAAAAKVHEDQLRHVRNGCLTRRNQNIATDGSRIEGSHKGWNSLMCGHASGLEMLVVLGHDHVLRRNIRVALRMDTPTPFAASTYGSHHTRLVNHTAREWNTLLTSKKRKEMRTYRGFTLKPELQKVSSKEKFGLTRSRDFETYGQLIKQEEPDEDIASDLLELVEEESEVTFQSVGVQLNVDPILFVTPDSCVSPSAGADLSLTHLALTHTMASTLPMTTPSRPASQLAQESDSPTVGLCASRAAPTMQPMDCDEIREVTGSRLGPRQRIVAATNDVLDLTLDDSDDDQQAHARTPANTNARSLKRKADQEAAATGSQLQRKRAQVSTSQGGSQPLQVASSNLFVRGSGIKASQPGRHILALFKNHKPPSRTSASTDPTSNKNVAKVAASFMVQAQADGPAITIDDAAIDPVLRAASDASDDTSLPAASSSQQPRRVEPSSGHPDDVAVMSATQRTNTTAFAVPATTHTLSLAAQAAALLAPLPVPASPLGLSRSERMWQYFSQVNARTLRIERGQEFYSFMDLRLEQKWATFSMTTRKWAVATRDYNECVTKDFAELNMPAPLPKHPRALVNQLATVEAMITDRIIKQEFRSRKGKGTTKFWSTHCAVIPLVKTESGAAKLRAPQTCQRCKAIKYSAGIGGEDNHRRLHCSDGVRSNMRIADKPPPWPQPEGIWTEGKKFHVVNFINTLIAMYEATVLRGEELSSMVLEFDAFHRFLEHRLLVDSVGAVFFPLYAGYEMVPDLREYLVVEHAGRECIRILCLSGDEAASLRAAVAGTSAAGASMTGAADVTAGAAASVAA